MALTSSQMTEIATPMLFSSFVPDAFSVDFNLPLHVLVLLASFNLCVMFLVLAEFELLAPAYPGSPGKKA